MSCSIITMVMSRGNCVHHGDDAARFRRRQPGSRLIEQEEPRLAGERQRDLKLALLAIGQGAHDARRRLGQAPTLEQPVRLRIHVAIARRRTQEPHAASGGAVERQQHAVQYREPREQIGNLKGTSEAEPRAPVRAQSRDVGVEQHDAAGGRRHVAGDGVK